MSRRLPLFIPGNPFAWQQRHGEPSIMVWNEGPVAVLAAGWAVSRGKVGRCLRVAVLPVILCGFGIARADNESVEPEPNPVLERQIKAVLETPPYKNAHWGLLVVDARTGQTLYERDGDQLF